MAESDTGESRALCSSGVDAVGAVAAVGGLVVPDGCGERQDALQHAGAYSLGFAPAVAFEIELGFERLVHGFR